MFIYNLALITLFWTILSVVNIKLKTLYSFNNISFNSFNLLVLTILLFSMAGVPPFIGFFSKLFILSLLTNNSFFILYFIFFIILFFGLYFYIQNIKFLYSTKLGELNYSYIKNEIVVLNYYYFVICILTVTCFGLFFIDDFILLFSWILY